ncbi:MAG: protease modulator HflC [Caulobacterales bacterium]|nr:protease modulator HflC [Caulobacterales bacterium]
MSLRTAVIGFLALLAIVTAWQTFYTVDQREQAVVLNLGRPVRVVNAVSEAGAGPGLHIKTPFLENVVKLDRRNIAQEADQEEIIAADLQRIVVDAFLRYRITQPLQYYRTLHDEQTASDQLERLLNSSLRQVLGSATQKEIISEKRSQLMGLIKADMMRRATASRLGIEIIDVRIKRADLPVEIQESVFNNMRTSRQQEASQKRAVGEQQKREKMAEADKDVTVTLASAREQAGQITGEGDAIRTRVFAQSFGKDPAFAAYFRSLQAYEAGLADGQTTMVLSPDSSAFFKYFQNGPGGASAPRRR